MKKLFLIVGLAAMLLLAGVTEVNGQSFTQWAVTASASSQYGSEDGDWSAKQLVGQPDVYPKYGDDRLSWTPNNMNNGRQWIEVGFREAVYVELVEIYETFNPGAVVKVELIDEQGGSHLIWEGSGGRSATTARIFSVDYTFVAVPCKGVRVTLDTDSVPGWNEIDAVSITGSYNSPWLGQGRSAEIIQWATGAKASSQYREDRWAPEQMTGRPDVYPRYGDHDTAWVASTQNGGEEWVELFYDEAVYVRRIDVYETCAPGAVVKAELFDEQGRSHVIWQGQAMAAPPESRVFKIENTNVDVPSRHIRLVLRTDQVPGWNEIDAVALIGTRTLVESPVAEDPRAQLAALILRLEEAVARGKADRSADPAYLQELEQILEALTSLRF